MSAILTSDTFHALANYRADVCITLLLPPPGAVSPHGYEVSLKHLLQQAEDTLEMQAKQGVGIDIDAARRLLISGRQWAAERQPWRTLKTHLAVFMADGLFQAYPIPAQAALPEVAMVAKHFYLKPLLPLVNQEPQFYVLALSQRRPRLLRYDASTNAATPLPLPHGTEGLKALDVHAEADMQRHTQTFQHGTPGGALTSHSHGAGDIQQKDKIKQFFLQISRDVDAILHASSAPLLLAGVDYLFPIYHDVNHYPHLSAEVIPGNPDDKADAELVQQALPLLQRQQAARLEHALASYKAHANTPQVTRAFKDIVRWSYDGRVETLFVAHDAERYGRFNPDNTQVQIHKPTRLGDEELANLAIIHTLSHRGQAYLLPRADMPRNAPLAAILRY